MDTIINYLSFDHNCIEFVNFFFIWQKIFFKKPIKGLYLKKRILVHEGQLPHQPYSFYIKHDIKGWI